MLLPKATNLIGKQLAMLAYKYEFDKKTLVIYLQANKEKKKGSENN